MKTVTVHRASDTSIGPCTIVIGESIAGEMLSPTTGEPLPINTVAHFIRYEADAIANALFDHLPLAVSASVMARMLERYGSQYLGGPRR